MILNGRTEGNPCGNYTHLNFNGGPSTVDYGLCNENTYSLICNFFVLSDHSKIVFKKRQQRPIKGKLYNWDKKVKIISIIKSRTV